MLAVAKHLLDIVSMLLDEGDDANSADADGSTLLHQYVVCHVRSSLLVVSLNSCHSASAWGQADMLYLLLNRGAAQSLGAKNKKGWTPIDYSYSAEIKDYILGKSHLRVSKERQCF